MPALDNIFSGFEINKNLNDLYTGPLFEVWHFDSVANSVVSVDIEQDANGEPDLAKFQNEQDLTKNWGYSIAYDPWGNTNWNLMLGGIKNQFTYDNNRYGKFWDSATQSFSTDGNGFLGVPKREGTGNDGVVPITDLPLNQYSAFIRQKINNPTGASYQGLFGTKDTVISRVLKIQENSTDAVDAGMGTPSYYKNGVPQSFANEGDAWTAYANEPVNVIGVVNFDLTVGRTVPEKLYFFGFASATSWEYEYFTSILIYTGGVGTSVDDTQVTEIQTLLDDTYTPVQIASGAVKFNDVAFSNGVVDFFSAPYTAQGAITKVEQVAINSGVATMTVERDPTKDYFGVARGMTQDFTGTLTAVAGTTLSTGLDLTGVSIGGANDDHYIFRATAGAGAGEEVTVLSRTGGDIVVNNNSGFDATTQFTLGRFVRGISRVFPKD